MAGSRELWSDGGREGLACGLSGAMCVLERVNGKYGMLETAYGILEQVPVSGVLVDGDGWLDMARGIFVEYLVALNAVLTLLGESAERSEIQAFIEHEDTRLRRMWNGVGMKHAWKLDVSSCPSRTIGLK